LNPISEVNLEMTDGKRLVPASPKNMVPWLIEALESGPLTRDEVLGRVESTGRHLGYSANDILTLKKALSIAKKDRKIQNLRKNWWALASNDISVGLPVEDESEIILGKRRIPVLRTIGSGSEEVYVFYDQEEAERAAAGGNDAWRCKIGKATKGAKHRLLGNGQFTYFFHVPIVGLLIRCENADAVEKGLKSGLQLAKVWLSQAEGKEFFRTSPARIESFYRAWISLCDALRLK
jgi:hypothetical protein